MLKLVKLNNFQSHVSSNIELSNGLTCIIGTSRSGKSSFVRALKWIFFGRWKSSFVRHGSKTSSIEIKIDNNEVKWIKGESVNKLIINGRTFTGFGNDLPEEFLKIFKWISLGEDFVIASQDDPPFLLFSKSLERCNVFDNAIGVNNVLKWIEDIKIRINQKVGSIKVLEDELTLIERKLNNLKNVEEKLNKIKLLYNEALKWNKQKETLDALIKLNSFIKDKERELNQITNKLINLQKYEKIILDFYIKEKLFELKESIKEKNIKLNDLNLLLSKKQEELSNLVKNGVICPVCKRPIEDISVV
jgi:exonuclease SbcC